MVPWNVLAQEVRVVPVDVEIKRRRSCLWGLYKIGGETDLDIKYLKNTDSTSIEILKNKCILGSIHGRGGDCIEKIVAHKNQALLLMSYQEDWSAFWYRSLILLEFSDQDTCDVHWLLVSGVDERADIADIAHDTKGGYCFLRDIDPVVNGVTREVITPGETVWFSLAGASKDLNFKNLAKLGDADYVPEQKNLIIHEPQMHFFNKRPKPKQDKGPGNEK